MSNEIARRESTNEKVAWAQALASSTLLPRQYQNNPGNLLFAVEYADALGVSRIHAVTSIHVIDGKPSASADLIGSLVRRAGHKLRVSGDDTYALAQIIRADDPDFTYEARWDMGKAKAAGLANKAIWRSYPGAMLRARAITEVARMAAPDALFGVAYSPEELGAEVNASGEVIAPPPTTNPQTSTPPSEPMPDYTRSIAAMTSLEDLRDLWNHIAQSWHLTPDVEAAINARVAELRQLDEVVVAGEASLPVDGDEPYEGEVEPAPGAAGAAGDVDTVWFALTIIAGRAGWTEPQLREALIVAHGGQVVEDLSAEKLAAFAKATFGVAVEEVEP